MTVHELGHRSALEVAQDFRIAFIDDVDAEANLVLSVLDCRVSTEEQINNVH